jgi:energy-coupling factor transport system permease protein
MNSEAFTDRDTLLHRLNPLTKLGFAVLIIIGLTLVVDPVTPALAAILLLGIVCLLGGVRPAEIVRLYLPVWFLSFGALWTTAVFYVPDPASHPRVLASVGPAVVLDQGVAYALVLFFRLQGFYAASLLYALTTDPTDLVRALVQKLGLSYRFGYGAHAAYRFVPLFEGELHSIRAAHRVRGVSEGGGPFARLRTYVGYLIPLLVGGVRQAERAAVAMDGRGFGAYPDRTSYRQSRFSRLDVIFAIGSLVVLGALVAELQALGWFGRLIPSFIGGSEI